MRSIDRLSSINGVVIKKQLYSQYRNQQMAEVQKQIQENITLKLYVKTIVESNQILRALKNHFIFYNLQENQLQLASYLRQNIKERMFYCEVEQNTILFDQNTIGSCFFIVEKGSLTQINQDNEVKEIRPQDGFGEVALLYKNKRTYMVRANQHCNLFVIDRKTFRSAVEQAILQQFHNNLKLLSGVKLFSTLNIDQRELIVSACFNQKFYKNQTIIQEGDPGSVFYYIKEGVASVSKNGKFIRKVNKGDSFGEQSLYYNTMRQLTITADDDVVCLVLGRDTLSYILGPRIYDVTFKNFLRTSLQKNAILMKLGHRRIEEIIESMKISSFKVGQIIFSKGVSDFQKLVVVIQGSLKKAQNGTIVAIKGDCYGEQFLLAQNKLKILEDEIIMQSYGVIAQISDLIFFQILGNKTYQLATRQSLAKGELNIFSNPQNILKRQLSQYTAHNFYKVQQLQRGHFGPVLLVQDQNLVFYVAKLIDKQLIQNYEVYDFCMNEKNVMDIVQFPFIVNSGKLFQSANYLCYINQFINGYEFSQVLMTLGLLSTSDSKFYTASIILILQYLQSIHIVCRDIKPESFLVDCSGYLKLINLSVARILKVDKTNSMFKTFSIIGTPHYMAPEIVLGKGYNNMVDLWSLGICLYEFLCGFLPFGDTAEGAYEIYQQIMQTDVKFPEFIQDKKSKKLTEQLLSHNPEQRHGGSFYALKLHSWFQSFQWNSLMQRENDKLIPPMYPTSIEISHSKKKLPTLFQTLQQYDGQKQKHQKLSRDWSAFGEMIN